MNKNFQMGMFCIRTNNLLVLFEVVSIVFLIKNDKKYLTYFESVGELRIVVMLDYQGYLLVRLKRFLLQETELKLNCQLVRMSYLKKIQLLQLT